MTGKSPSQSTAGGDVEEGLKHLHQQSHVEGNSLWKLFDAIRGVVIFLGAPRTFRRRGTTRLPK